MSDITTNLARIAQVVSISNGNVQLSKEIKFIGTTNLSAAGTVGRQTTTGITIWPVAGSTNDFQIYNAAGSASAMHMPTGTSDWVMASKLGIGITPTAQLQVITSGNQGNWALIGTGAICGEGIGAYPSFGYGMVGDGATGWKYLASDYASWVNFASGTIKFNVAGSGTPGSTLTPYEAGMFDNNGCLFLSQSASLASGVRMGITCVGAGSQYGLAINATSVSASSTRAIEFLVGGSVWGHITYGSSSVAYNTSSDAALKNVLPSQRDFRSIIEGVWVGDFEFKEEPGSPVMGILAQQAALAGFCDAVTAPLMDEEGNYKNDSHWSADYARLAPLALWGVKDQYALIEALKVRIEALEAKLAA